jgi:hypothetical protein
MNKRVYTKETMMSLAPKPYAEEFSNYGEVDNRIKESKKPVVITKPVESDSLISSKYLAMVENKYESESESEDDVIPTNKPKISNKGNGYITQFYIGSLSVIGLFVFFRYMYKRK